jgi:hypothetical protein
MGSVLASNALCTLKEFEDYRDKKGNEPSDIDVIIDLINSISTFFENYCGRKFTAANYTEYHDGGVQEIFPYRYPIISVSSIHVDSDWEWGSSTLVASGGYITIDDLSIYSSSTFSSGRKAIKLVYRAGYETIPNDLKQAAILETSRLYGLRKDIEKTSVTISDGNVTFIVQDFLPQTKKILEYYKHIGVV